MYGKTNRGIFARVREAGQIFGAEAASGGQVFVARPIRRSSNIYRRRLGRMPSTRTSTSACALTYNGCIIKTLPNAQPRIALSSAEAELCAEVGGAHPKP